MASVKYDEGKIIDKAGELAAKFSEMLQNHGTDESKLASAFSPYKQTLKDLWHSGCSKRKIADVFSDICGIELSESQVRTLFKKLGIISHRRTHKCSDKPMDSKNNNMTRPINISHESRGNSGKSTTSQNHKGVDVSIDQSDIPADI